MIETFNIWYRKKNTSKYFRIKDYIYNKSSDPVLSCENDTTNKFFEFRLFLWNPKDSENNYYFPVSGDEIVVTDINNQVLLNKFIGIINKVTVDPKGYKQDGDSNKLLELSIRMKDYSIEDLYLEKTRTTYINDLIPIILNTCTDLGGIKSNGLVIQKYNYAGENYAIPPQKIQDSNFNVLNKILDLVSLSQNFRFYCELDSINGLKIIKQIEILPKDGYVSLPDDWQSGITDETFKNSIVSNTSYPNYDDREYIYTENHIKRIESIENLKNSIKLKMFVRDMTPNGKRKTITSTGALVYEKEIGGAFDIESISVQIEDTIKNVSSTTEFKLNLKFSACSYYQNRLNNNNLNTKMRCRIISSSNEYLRYFTLDLVTEVCTLEESISSLANNDYFELIGCYDILPTNLNSYPPDENGYIKKYLDNENSRIEFTKYDAPEKDREIIIYYYPIKVMYYTKIDPQSIKEVGLRGLTETIKEAVTPDQGNLLFTEYKKQMKPLYELNIDISHRKSILPINAKIHVDFEGLKDDFIVTKSSIDIYHDQGWYRNKPLVVQRDLVISSYKYNIDDLLAIIKNTAEAILNLNISNVLESIFNGQILFNQKTNILSVVSQILSNDLQIDSSTLIAWNYQEGLGTIINSSNPATLVGSVIGDVSSIWQSGLLVKDTHSLKLNGTDNFVQTANYAGTITDFTIRKVFRFNTGDKASKSSHILFSRYDTFLSQDDNTAVFILEYNSVNNQISMLLNDVSGSFANLKYRNPYFVYNLNENQDYIIQASFKLQDSSNSNLNKIEICVNGIPQTLNYSNDTISNINGLNQVNIPFFDSIYRANNGVRYYSKYSNSRMVFDLRFRTSSEALIDAQNLGLA